MPGNWSRRRSDRERVLPAPALTLLAKTSPARELRRIERQPPSTPRPQPRGTLAHRRMALPLTRAPRRSGWYVRQCMRLRALGYHHPMQGWEETGHLLFVMHDWKKQKQLEESIRELVRLAAERATLEGYRQGYEDGTRRAVN